MPENQTQPDDTAEDLPGQGDDGGSYDPSDVESTRMREQGNGVGQRDLDQQRDANRPDLPTQP